MPDTDTPVNLDTSTTESKLFDLLAKQSTQATTERAALATAFTDALSGLRWELRILVVLFAALALARDGVLAKIGIPGVTIETHSASMVPTAAASEPVEPAPSDLPDLPAPTP